MSEQASLIHLVDPHNLLLPFCGSAKAQWALTTMAKGDVTCPRCLNRMSRKKSGRKKK